MFPHLKDAAAETVDGELGALGARDARLAEVALKKKAEGKGKGEIL